MNNILLLEKIRSFDYTTIQPSKWVMISGSVGVGIVGVIAIILRRRRKQKFDSAVYCKHFCYKNVTNNSSLRKKLINHTPVSKNSSRSHTPAPTTICQDDSTLTGNIDQEHSPLIIGPEKLCSLGLDSLAQAIKHWEDALSLLECNEDHNSTKNVDENDIMPLQDQLHSLLSRAYRIQNQYESNIYNKLHLNAAVATAVGALKDLDDYDDVSSDTDSFVSAVEIADLSDLEEEHEKTSFSKDLQFYNIALKELNKGSISCRTLRTRQFSCNSDTEFLAKIFCLRLAFNELFKVNDVKSYFIKYGKLIIGEMLLKAQREATDFYNDFDQLIQWVSDENNWKCMKEELRNRGVIELNFFDIVLDFIVFDAFDDLENPPSALTSVMNNRWLSNGFKETAMSTGCWSVLRAKRSRLQFSNGFLSHFYSVTEHCSPMFAWALLGPPTDMTNICMFFKSEVISFMKNIFSFNHVRFTNVSDLAVDILKQAQYSTVKLLNNLSISTDEATREIRFIC